MNIGSRPLRLFEATARLGKLTLAADEQAISQSAASQSIRELERALDYPLLERKGRELVLTASGQRILPRVRQILSLIDGLARPDERQVAGVLNLSASVTIAGYLLPAAIARFRDRHSDASVRLDICNSQTVIERVLRGRAQLGLIEGPALHPALDIIPWRRDRLEVFCAPDHPLANMALVDNATLAQQDWILRETGSGTRAVLEAAMQQDGVKPRVLMELPRHEIIKQSVRVGLGIGCLSALALQDELAAGQLVTIPTRLNLARQLSWVCASNEREHPLLLAMVEVLTDLKLEQSATT